MGLITKKVIVKWANKTKKYYENKGYVFTKYGDEFNIKTDDLPNSSKIPVIVKCEECGKESLVSYVSYYKRTKEKTYCQKCAVKLFSIEGGRISKLNKSVSIEQWCIKNNKLEILERWDYNLNEYKPSELSYNTNKKCWLKCSRGLHESELKRITDYVRGGRDKHICCKKCSSFAQWGIDNVNEMFLEKYWDYEMNKNINPWNISLGTRKVKVWIKCQENKTHDSYLVTCCHFTTDESRCPICCGSKGEKRIKEYLQNNKIKHVPQKHYKELKGLGEGSLSYDFYLPKYNILIEYQGIQHEKISVGFHKNKSDFEKQLEHDRRKRKYAENNNIKLIEIWYRDYDNIEKILNEIL